MYNYTTLTLFDALCAHFTGFIFAHDLNLRNEFEENWFSHFLLSLGYFYLSMQGLILNLGHFE
jgi:hypothetical protein